MEIKAYISDPSKLEYLYRENKREFKEAFNAVYPEIRGTGAAEFWHSRLNYPSSVSSKFQAEHLIFVLFIAFLAGIFAKFPDLLSIDEEFFYPRNFALLLFPFLSAIFLYEHKFPLVKVGWLTLAVVVMAIYINLLPENGQSDTLVLACFHLPVLLWAVAGVAFSKSGWNRSASWLDFLRFNGDLAVMTVLLGLAGGLLSGITIALFELIGLDIAEFYFKNIALFLLPGVPIVATYLTRTQPQLVSKVSPVIAKVFSPLVLVMLSIYLVAIFLSGKDPYTDREFLIVFNILLGGVMALIFFSLSGSSNRSFATFEKSVLFALAVVTAIVNSIALSAISYRISEWGITPNRIAVLGTNLIMLIHLLTLLALLFRSLFGKGTDRSIEKAVIIFIPAYLVWAAIVVFVFPGIFGFE